MTILKIYLFSLALTVQLFPCLTLPLVPDNDVEELEDLNVKSKILKLEEELLNLKKQLARFSTNDFNKKNDTKTKNVEKSTDGEESEGVFGVFYDYPVEPSFRRIIDKRQVLETVESHLQKVVDVAKESGLKVTEVLDDLNEKNKKLIENS